LASASLRDPLEILADAQHAVRIVTDQIGVDEAARDGTCLIRMRAPACMMAAVRLTRLAAGTVFICNLVDLGLRRGRRSLEKIEIAALIGLRDVLLIERTEAALVARGGFFHSARRRASSASVTFNSSFLAATSSWIRSPSRTSANGPPTYDSGATCSTHAP